MEQPLTPLQGWNKVIWAFDTEKETGGTRNIYNFKAKSYTICYEEQGMDTSPNRLLILSIFVCFQFPHHPSSILAFAQSSFVFFLLNCVLQIVFRDIILKYDPLCFGKVSRKLCVQNTWNWYYWWPQLKTLFLFLISFLMKILCWIRGIYMNETLFLQRLIREDLHQSTTL